MNRAVGGSGLSRVLIVDDQPVGRLLKRRIEQHAPGIQATWATTIREAERLLGEPGWVLAVIDVQLADGSGLEVVRRIRRTGSDLPIVVITGSDLRDRIDKDEIVNACALLDARVAMKPDIVPVVLRSLDIALARSLQISKRDRVEAAVRELSGLAGLSAQQALLVMLAVRGVPRREIARELGVEVSTLNTYVERVMAKWSQLPDAGSIRTLADVITYAVAHLARSHAAS